MSNKVNILGVSVDKANVEKAVEKISQMLHDGKKHCVYTPNSEIIMNAYENPDFAAVLNSADLLTADGIGVVYASKILGNPIDERAPGFDIACGLIEKAAKEGYGIYFFGGKPGIAEQAQKNLEAEYPFLRIVGTHNGYFTPEDEPEIIADINRSNADIVFVCLGAPKQETWIHNNRQSINAAVLMGVGGSLDVFAGTVERAPDIWCRLGLEWLYRLIKQPSRFMRMTALPRFAATVILKGHRYAQEGETD